MTGCEYNPHGVTCERRNCASCGWYPQVEKKRKDYLRSEEAKKNAGKRPGVVRAPVFTAMWR